MRARPVLPAVKAEVGVACQVVVVEQLRQKVLLFFSQLVKDVLATHTHTHTETHTYRRALGTISMGGAATSPRSAE